MQSSQGVKPNIVFILLDNTGWGDLGAYGGQTPTPRIDALAAEGIRFTNYNVEVQCTPTRSAILTGRHPVRSGTLRVPYPGEGASGLAPWEYTLANLLSDAGYATALYGKWHLGDTQGRLPNDQGFDEWWGYPNSADEAGYSAWPLFTESGCHTPMLLQGKKGEPSTPVMPFDLEVRPVLDGQYIIPKTVEFIRREAEAKRPFFAYVGYSELHPPCIPNPQFAGTSRERSGIYSDIIGEIDYRVGEILDALDEAGVRDDTIVIVSSDNGTGGLAAPPGGSNGPWRGNFFNTPFEGSHRVPAIVRWPGRIRTGLITNQMLGAVDWLPTLASMVGASKLVPTDRPIDGVDASAFMLGTSEQTNRDSYLFFGTDAQLMSVKWKHYKIVFRYSEGLERPIVTPQFPMVYDLISDPHEDFNLFSCDMTVGWLLVPAFRAIGEYQQSIGKYPNIKTGDDFKGYS